MKSMQQWFDEYAVSHQNSLNLKIHFICVPAIFFSIVGMIMSIDSTFLLDSFGLKSYLFLNWASVSLIPVLVFYLRLSVKVFVQMLLFSLVCIVLNYYISLQINLLFVSISIFIIAWIGQFYGHHVEGKKPSFVKDLQFLLIGPAWVFEKLGRSFDSAQEPPGSVQ